MVGFGKRMAENQVPEWSTEYLPYKKLKKLLKALVQKVSTEEGAVERKDVSQHAAPAPGHSKLMSHTVRKCGGLITVRGVHLTQLSGRSPNASRACD